MRILTIIKFIKIVFRLSDHFAKWMEHLPRAVDAGLIPSRVTPEAFKLVFTAFLFDVLRNAIFTLNVCTSSKWQQIL